MTTCRSWSTLTCCVTNRPAAWRELSTGRTQAGACQPSLPGRAVSAAGQGLLAIGGAVVEQLDFRTDRPGEASLHRLQDGQALANQASRDLAQPISTVEHADVGGGEARRSLLHDHRQLLD